MMVACLPLTQLGLADDDLLERTQRTNDVASVAVRRTKSRAARGALRRAIRAARRAGTRGPTLARSYAELGVVLASGTHEQDAAVRAFRRALREDPTISLPPEQLTSEVRAALRLASAESMEAGASAPPGSEPPAQPAPSATTAVPSPAEAARSRWQATERTFMPASIERADAAPEPAGALHREEHAHPRWFADMSVGVGFSALRTGHTPDHPPAPSMIDALVEHATDGGEKRLSIAEVERELREHGWDCDARTHAGEVTAENCVVATRPGISVVEPILDMAFGYHVLPRWAMALSALVQRSTGPGPMAGVVVGLRSEYMLTAPAERGFQLGAIAGLGVGSLRARGRGAGHEAPHATHSRRVGSVVSLGSKAAYRANRHLAFALMPLFSIGLPYVLYDIGLTGGFEVAF